MTAHGEDRGASAEDLRVWIGCLACYNDGRLVGQWVDALEAGEPENRPHATRSTPNPDASIVLDQAHEETWCLDVEGPFLAGEMSPSEAQRIAEAVDGLPDWIDLDALASYLDNTGESVTDGDVLEGFEDSFAGTFRSGAEYAWELAEGTSAVPEDLSWPLGCIDWERAWRELAMDGYWISDAGHVFRS